MKNMKNMVAAAVMMGVMAFGTTFANAGIIIAKDSRTTDETCKYTNDRGGVLNELGGWALKGIIIAKTGIIIASTGIIIAKDAPCTDSKTKEGIIIA
jgi:hypothetical protein